MLRTWKIERSGEPLLTKWRPVNTAQCERIARFTLEKKTAEQSSSAAGRLIFRKGGSSQRRSAQPYPGAK
jgi:hypothetical protein